MRAIITPTSTASSSHRAPAFGEHAAQEVAATDIEIDLARFEVRQHGRRIDLQPLPFDLLAHLATHRHRVVTRDELLEVVWEGTPVCDGAINQAIWTLRSALGDEKRPHRLIRTIHRRGYRFVGTDVVIVTGTRGDRRLAGIAGPVAVRTALEL